MIRFLFSFSITIIAGRWIYSEIQTFAPAFLPIVNMALEKTSIPTHDKWDVEAIEKTLNKLGLSVDSMEVKGNQLALYDEKRGEPNSGELTIF